MQHSAEQDERGDREKGTGKITDAAHEDNVRKSILHSHRVTAERSMS